MLHRDDGWFQPFLVPWDRVVKVSILRPQWSGLGKVVRVGP